VKVLHTKTAYPILLGGGAFEVYFFEA